MHNYPRNPDGRTRLTRAFEALNAAGIFARERYWCCQSCGCAGVERDAPNWAQGYAFYHEQDNESRLNGEGFHISYGDVSRGDSLRVGRTVVRILSEHGVPTEWDGSPARRIFVPGVPGDRDEEVPAFPPVTEDEEEEEEEDEGGEYDEEDEDDEEEDEEEGGEYEDDEEDDEDDEEEDDDDEEDEEEEE